MRGRPAGPPSGQQKPGPCTPRRGCPSFLASCHTGLPGPRGGHLGLGRWWVTTSLHTARPTARAEESRGLLHGPRARAGPAARQDSTQMAAARATAGAAAALCPRQAGGRRPRHPDPPALPAASRSYTPARVRALSPPPQAAPVCWGERRVWNVWVSRQGGGEPLPFTRPFITHSLTHSLAHSFTHAYIHSLVHSRTRSFT